jgi:hypothetical protein
MSTLAQILKRLDALEARLTPPVVEDHGPAIAARLKQIRERLDEARAAGHYTPTPGRPPSGSRLSGLIAKARAAKARAAL